MSISYELLKSEFHLQNELINAVFNAMENVCYLIVDAKDPQYKIINCTPSGERLFGYHPDDVKGKPVSFIQRPEANEVMDNHTSKMKTGCITNFEKETRFCKKNGEEFYGYFKAIPLRDEKGEVIAFLGICLDIDESKKMEMHLREAYKLESISTLAAGIAHDFNNILSVIMGSAELSLYNMEDNPKKAEEGIQQIITASERARYLVKQIMTFTREVKDDKKSLLLKPLFKEVIRFIRSTIPSTIAVEYKINLDDEVVCAEPSDIHQILMNLCTNAAHAMSDSYGTLTIKAQKKTISENEGSSELPPGEYVNILISDTGCGIKEEYKSRIFDPYFTTKKKDEGTGLGLSMVHGIVNKLNGSINFTSTCGDGTTFNIYLPLYSEEALHPQETDKEEIKKGNGERVLFVDDEKQIADIAKETLKNLGYMVETRTSSVEALEKIKSGPDKYFDLVITDFAMPNLSGLDFAREVHLLNPDLPIILCTGLTRHFDDKVLRNHGIRDVLKKPMLKHSAAETIHRVLPKNKNTGEMLN